MVTLLLPTVTFGQTVPTGIVPDTTANSANTSVIFNTQDPSVAIVGDGSQSGANLYHRFSAFDTSLSQDNLSRVFFNMGSAPGTSAIENVIVGVSATTAISVPIVLSQSANIIFMPLFGIILSGTAGFGFGAKTGSFSPLPKLALTTANRLEFTNPAGIFEVEPTTANYPSGSPNPQISGFTALGIGSGPIILDGQAGAVTLQVDQALLIAQLDSQTPGSYAPVQVKGEVSLGTTSTGTIAGNFSVGEWSNATTT